ncbi:hypothetical protein BOTBODRAFT_180896 [Botryobasidium botryosum FD-172 SS1]|uniref:Uncharacterized protein n=1 Tax=Botryobasidium botryosum (strain FD-172 SS1) TaxID=930990 RepID=A0A067LV69_BOTB1|nr:hypothetical protein BOTBODRAFT_180896 [Botryobasidium botryosum FD-172 SS1]
MSRQQPPDDSEAPKYPTPTTEIDGDRPASELAPDHSLQAIRLSRCHGGHRAIDGLEFVHRTHSLQPSTVLPKSPAVTSRRVIAILLRVTFTQLTDRL